jgi:ABC-type polysaccharide/polyol phosphate transport system ATPase subunit
MPADTTRSRPEQASATASADRGVAIEARGVEKTFRIPKHRVSRLKEQVLHPLSQRQVTELHALRGVSFDVQRGEFFGIVGRNGSGKSTLLKILASIYAADAGSVRMAGLPAPFIELGVGFNMELTARENVELNGVMMGLTRQQAKSRIDAVLEFAELERFVDMKLKNYSSGMLVRIAFSVMIQSEADILLIDEVLAVGDAAFQQKCADVFHEVRDSPRTVVLVTHDMSAVERYCHRALLLNDGHLELIGDPDKVARRYMKLNFEGRPAEGDAQHADGQTESADIRLLDAWLQDGHGERSVNVEQGAEFTFHALFEARRDVEGPSCGFMFTNAAGVDVFGFAQGLAPPEEPSDRISGGERMHVTGTIDNRLAAGRYLVKCWVYRRQSAGDLVLHAPHVLDFVVFGHEETPGMVSLVNQVTAVPERINT